MRRLLSILILLLIPISVWAWGVIQMSGGVSAPAACATSSIDHEYDDTFDYSLVPGAAAKGQSFIPVASGSLKKISMYCVSNTGGGLTLEMRWGPDPDLATTYAASKTITVSATGWADWEFDTAEAVTAETEYYFGIIVSSGAGTANFEVDNTDLTYAGEYRYASSGWNMSSENTARECSFRIYLCD